MFIKHAKASRKRVKEGDLFVMSLDDDAFLFGRVMRTPVAWAAGYKPEATFCTIYLYATVAKSKDDIPDDLSTDNLLLPPMITNHQGWLKGYFETIDNRPIKAGERLDVHCFYTRRLIGTSTKPTVTYYNDLGEEIKKPKSTPLGGDYGLDSYASIYDKVAHALGIEQDDDDADD